MQLETVSKIKGWGALVMLGLPMLLTFWPWNGAIFHDFALPLSILWWIGLFVGISWLWQRKRMRFLAYQAKLNRQG